MSSSYEISPNIETTPGAVQPGVYSQKPNYIGIHWLRVSFQIPQLKTIKELLGIYFGECQHSERGLWSYDQAYQFSEGVSLNYDSDVNRCLRIHRGKFTVDIPGTALDCQGQNEVMNLIRDFSRFSAQCSRIDLFFDDNSRRISPHEIATHCKKGNFSGAKVWQIKEGYRQNDMIYDEVDFGRRGSSGSGRYLRIYDKALESDGENKAVRYEAELSGERSKMVFDKLALTEDLTAYATIIGAVISGSIRFVKRDGQKNIKRMEVLEFWQSILEELGNGDPLALMTKETNFREKCEWVVKQVTPTLACIRKVYETDNDFMDWVLTVINDNEDRMNVTHKKIIEKEPKRKRQDLYNEIPF